MVFASGVFLYYFLPIFLALYYLTPRGWRNATLAVASYVFYGWWRPDFVILMWISTVVDFGCGRRIRHEQGLSEELGGPRKGKRWMVLSLCVNLGLLAYFKYFNFGVDTLNSIMLPFDGPLIDVAKVILPVGISFYTFQTISYTVDVYRGTAEPVRSFRDFMCYVAMFPQLVAGPIVRYNTVAKQLAERTHTRTKFYCGVLFFQAGLAKKILVADILGGVADQAFDGRALGLVESWLGTLAYSFQIYFDFSGYSDMAIGLGLMMGFCLPPNFDRPYASVSITDFWRRWHISLSTFLRDYLYIPLGGNRLGALRTYVNLALVMLLGGLWHGANWTFVAWGAWQGLWLILERLGGKDALYARAPHVIRVAATFALVLIGWVFFRAESIADAGSYLGGMFGFTELSATARALDLRAIHAVAGLAGALILWSLPTTQRLVEKRRTLWVLSLQLAFWVALVHLHHEDQVPFLYFQF